MFACINDSIHSTMEFKSDWSGLSGDKIEFEDMGSQFSSFVSASNGSLPELSSSSISGSILASSGVKDYLRNVISARMVQVPTSTQSWLWNIEVELKYDFNIHKLKCESLVSEGRPLDVKDQCEFVPVLKQLSNRGSKTDYCSKISARPANYDFSSRMTKLQAEHQVLTDESIGSSEGSSETENSFDVSFSLDQSVISRRVDSWASL